MLVVLVIMIIAIFAKPWVSISVIILIGLVFTPSAPIGFMAILSWGLIRLYGMMFG